ncbi:MAG: YncE family protein, partial [Candidatus Limnocylindria bacterium]
MRQAQRPRRPGGRLLGVVAATLLTLSVVPAAATGQEVGEDDGEAPSGSPTPGEIGEDEADDDAPGVSLAPRRLELPDDLAPSPFFLWPGGRRGYYFVEPGFRQKALAAVDLDRLEEVARSDILPFPTLFVRRHQVAVDHAGGRLFITIQDQTLLPFNASGVAVVDGRTLEVVRQIPFQAFTLDGGNVFRRVLALEYAPPVANSGGKLLVLADEATYPATVSGAELNKQANRVYAVQLDPDTGDQDWALELTACRGRWPDFQGTNFPGTIFRSGDGRHVYAACNSTGSTAAARIVRIPLDDDGLPPLLPVEPGDPVRAATRAVDGEAPSADDVVVRNEAVEAFPGPAFAGSFLADPATERIFMRVLDGDPPAEVWWVFDGRFSEYVGTIGIANGHRDATAAPGFDREAGRFYVLGPELENSRGATVAPGGLFVTDARRTPLAQALRFGEFATLAALVSPTAGQNTIPIEVDPSSEDRPTRLFFRPGIGSGAAADLAPDHYFVIEDSVAVSTDPPPEDFAGLTTDVPERPGVTSASFEAAARGYGFRTLLVGGAEAVFRLGPIDASLVKGAGSQGRTFVYDDGTRSFEPRDDREPLVV